MRRGCVVVGTDFSEGAEGALQEGRWLAREARLDLQVLHVAELGTPWQPTGRSRDWLATASLDPAMVIVRPGRPWAEIIRHAQEVSAAVVVLGSHGASGFQAMTLGSTASRVALRAPCPVLLAARRIIGPPADHTAITSPNSL
jgi:nucleotide-binding universal stress UspA family protein